MRSKTHLIQRCQFGPPCVLALMLVTLILSACTLEVQPIESFTSADGFLSFTFPAHWDLVKAEYGAGSDAALVATSDDLIDHDVIPAGDAGVAVLLMPDFMPGPDGEPIRVTAQELAGLMRKSAITQQPGVSDLETVTLDNGAETYTFNAPSPEGNMKMHLFSPAQGTIAIVAFMTASEDVDADILSDAKAILESVRFSGDPVEFTERAHAIVDSGQ